MVWLAQLFYFHIIYMGIEMLKTSVQHIPRKQRLSSKDLTRLIRMKSPCAKVVFNHGEGWSIYQNSKLVIFIGDNWVEAHHYIRQMPASPRGIIYQLVLRLVLRLRLR